MFGTGEKMHFESYIPGVPVVFLHAFPMNHKMWEPQMRFLRKRKIAFIAPDYPGFGDTPLRDSSLAIDDYAGMVFRLLEEMGIREVIVAGLSMGGYVALSLYRQHPEIFRGLMLADTKAVNDSEEGRQGRLQMIRRLGENPDLVPIIDSFLEKFFTPAAIGENRAVVETARAIMNEATVGGICAAQTAMAGRPDSTSLLSRMNFPVAVVTGDQDALSTVDAVKEMSMKIRNSQQYVLSGAAHLSNMERPDIFNDILGELIERSV